MSNMSSQDGPPPDVYSIGDMAGLQQLWMHSPEVEEAVQLTGLGKLRELTYINSWTLRHSPLPISADAALTKLALGGHWGRDFHDLFPLATLRNVVELTIDCSVDSMFTPELPSSWGLLTDPTSLSLSLKSRDSKPALPSFGAKLRHLRHLDASMEFAHFSKEGLVETIQWLFTNMPRLTRLGVRLYNLLVTGLTEPEAVEWLEELCCKIERTLAGVSCAVPTVTKTFHVTGNLVLTCMEDPECTEEWRHRV